VFAGATDALTAGGPEPALPEHAAPCVRRPDRFATAAGVRVPVHRWTSCPNGTSYSEVVLRQPGFGVYVQIRQVDGPDKTDEILAGLRLSAYS
jgi:eukaryotic-like serine/threonine-protein kinase